MAILRGIRGKGTLLLMIVAFLLLGLNDIRCSADEDVRNPEPASVQQIKFFLNSREKAPDVNKTVVVSYDDLTWKNFESFVYKVKRAWHPRHNVVFIIHGWTKSADFHIFPNMMEALLNKSVNVARVDWRVGAGHPDLGYFQSAANTAIVGKEIAKFIALLVQLFRMKPEQFHIIGHSLGAHAAGYAGMEFLALYGQKIARISGLDPAYPLFKGEHLKHRLDASDAAFVDVIHTDVNVELGAGTSDLSGHIDFFPNGGDDQPGCQKKFLNNCPKDHDLDGSWFWERGDSCNHKRSVEYYIESINGVDFKGRVCGSWKDYTSKKCINNQEIVMGYHAKPPKSNLKVYMPINTFSAYYLKDRTLSKRFSYTIWDINEYCCHDPDPDNGEFRGSRCQSGYLVGCGSDSHCWKQTSFNSTSWCVVRTSATDPQPLKCDDAERCLNEEASIHHY